MKDHEFNMELSSIHDRLRNFAYSLTSNVEDAQDLTQDTIFNAYKSLAQFNNKYNFSSWIFTIMRNLFINHYNRRLTKRELLLYDEYESINNLVSDFKSADHMLYMADIQKILNQLDDSERIPFLMYVDGFKYAEIAEKMDLPIGTIKSKIFRTRKKLIAFINNSK